MSEDKERDVYDRYIKPQRTLWQRIKRWLSPTRAIKTIKDVELLDWDFIIKIIGVMMIMLILQMVGGMVADAYFWFFPPVHDMANCPFAKLLEEIA